jgi:4-hydroxy-4-methyl-2-oxoglutarate aldolase
MGRVAVSHVSDALGRVGVPAAMLPLNPQTTLLGTAYTARPWPGDNLTLHYALKHASPGQVLVVDGGGRTDIALWGELMSLCAKEQGLAGIVVDGAVRDRDALSKMDFPVYARAVTPRGPVKATMGQVNCPVTCGGVVVQPGDLIFGDADGVVVIPQERADQILTAAQAVAAKEVSLQEQIRAGGVLFDLLGLDQTR